MKSLIALAIVGASFMFGSALAVEMPEMARKNHCSACHSIDKQVVGPSWMDISTKYKGVADFEFKGRKYPLEEGLVMKVSKGGLGNWGAMPMPSNDPTGAMQTDIKELVKFVISLAQ